MSHQRRLKQRAVAAHQEHNKDQERAQPTMYGERNLGNGIPADVPPGTPQPQVLVIPPGAQVVAVIQVPGQPPAVTVNVEALPNAFWLKECLALELQYQWMRERAKPQPQIVAPPPGMQVPRN